MVNINRGTEKVVKSLFYPNVTIKFNQLVLKLIVKLNVHPLKKNCEN